MPATQTPREPIPALTADDLAAAFPVLKPHSMEHAPAFNSLVLFDHLEAWNNARGNGQSWATQAWFGGDINRLWLRSEGQREDRHLRDWSLDALYGHAISPWWDVVAGVRHDFRPGDGQNFVGVGVQGLAPQKFEVSAMAYVGERGQTAARFEAEYELLLTNRLILQPLAEVDFYGKNDTSRGIGSGLSTGEIGLRLRYEFTRRFAPYIGVVYERAFGNTADMRREHGESFEDTRLVIGLRTWF